MYRFENTHKVQINLSPFLWKTLRNLALKYGSSILEVLRMSILLAGAMCDCLPEGGEDK